MLKEVDAERISAPAQALYSQQDDMQWFINVTDELYRDAVCRELPDAAPCMLQRALEQVYTVRATVEDQGNSMMLAQLNSLLHVWTDLAWQCPLIPGQVLPPDLLLHRLPIHGSHGCVPEVLDHLVCKADSLPTVLLVGSWS